MEMRTELPRSFISREALFTWTHEGPTRISALAREVAPIQLTITNSCIFDRKSRGVQCETPAAHEVHQNFVCSKLYGHDEEKVSNRSPKIVVHLVEGKVASEAHRSFSSKRSLIRAAVAVPANKGSDPGTQTGH